MVENKKLTPQQALKKITHYCAYQERSHQEVRTKLFAYGLWAHEVEDLLCQLITEGYLNEARFAKAFAGGKFRIKKWGRVKIGNELERHGLTPNCIRLGLREIPETDYHNTLKALLLRKESKITDTDPFRKREKLVRYALVKGYEPTLIWGIVREILPS